MEKAELRSRYKRQSDGKKYEFTTTDFAILSCLIRYPYLTATHIAALTGIKLATVQDRLTVLRNATTGQPEHYLDYVTPSLHTEIIYWAGEKAEPFLRARCYPVPHYATLISLNGRTAMPHDIAVSLVAANIEAGMRGTKYKLITPPEIRAGRNYKLAEEKHGKYCGIPVDFKYTKANEKNERHVQTTVVRDNLFGIENTETGKSIFIGHEHENETPTEIKLRTAMHIARNKLYKEYWGVESNITLITAPTELRLANKMELLSELTSGKGASHIIFRVMETMRDMLRPTSRDTDAMKVPKPDPTFFSTPFARVGHPPFSLMI